MRVRRIAVVAAGLLFSVAGPLVAASADDYPGTTVPTVEALQLNRKVATIVVDPARSSNLPVTGGDLAGMAAIGLGAVGVGTVLVRRSRRTATT